MKNKIFYCFLILSLLYATQSLNKRVLDGQIRNTRDLIKLYQQKLQILEELYQKNQSFISQNQFQSQTILSHHFNIQAQHSTTILQKSAFDTRFIFLSPKYLIQPKSKSVHTLQGTKMFEFLGQFLIAEPYKITTLLTNNIVNILQFDQYNKKQQKFFAFTAERGLNTLWHISNDYKIEDVLVQVSGNNIIMKSNSNKNKQTSIQLNDSIIDIYSLNQYKVFFLTQKSYGIVNMRSFSVILEFNFTNFIEINAQKYAKQNQNISNNFQKELIFKNLTAISSFKLQQFIYILLNDFRLVRYRQYSYAKDNFNFDLMDIKDQNIVNKFSHQNVTVHFVYPHLFLSKYNQSDFLVYNTTFSGNFFFWTQIKLSTNFFQQKQGQIAVFNHQFFKYQNSIRLLLTKLTKDSYQVNRQESFYFDLQLSNKKQVEYQYSSVLWKIALVALIVGLLVLIRFKTTKSQLMNSVDGNNMENQKNQSSKSNSKSKYLKNIKNKDALSQIQSFIQQKKQNGQVQNLNKNESKKSKKSQN